jgi:prepilin-type processing-associated H-X9-DG protein
MTLVEMLVMTLTVAIVVVALVPLLVRAKERKRRAQCVTNLKQLGLGIAIYYDNQNPNQMPQMTSVSALFTSIAPYVVSIQPLAVCPSDKTTPVAASVAGLTRSSYAWTVYQVWAFPAMYPMMFDRLGTGITTATATSRWSKSDSSHKDGGNMLWSDGHVAWHTTFSMGNTRVVSYALVND